MIIRKDLRFYYISVKIKKPIKAQVNKRKGRKINMENILVTGAAGFIGSNFVEYFTNK